MAKPKASTKDLDEANAEREQAGRARAALRTELEQTGQRADAVLERLRAKVAKRTPALRLVRGR